jgi:hypothetical protein
MVVSKQRLLPACSIGEWKQERLQRLKWFCDADLSPISGGVLYPLSETRQVDDCVHGL